MNIWEIAANTPWWVYVLFVYLMQVGFRATRPSIVPLRRMLILPSIFIFASFFSMYHSAQLSVTHVGFWMFAFIIGSTIGWLQFKALKITAVKNSTSLYVPGTWSLLVLILIIFAAKYYTGYQNAVDAESIQTKSWIFLLYGAFTGLFVGRMFYAIRCIKIGPYAADEAVAKVG